jgi:hypothetical protein
MNTYTRTFLLIVLLGLLAGPRLLLAQNQTSDPLVDQQQYLFDVHRVDQAWSYTTGSSNVTTGLYSMLGFIQNHEDLSSNRLQSPVGTLLRPKLDVASQMAGIVGAATNNGVGMAGIDRAGRLQSYSALLSAPECLEDCDQEEAVTFDHPDGTIETFYLNLYRFNDIVEQGRSNGVDVHLFSFGLPSALPPDYDIPEPEDSSSVNLPNVPSSLWEAFKQKIIPEFKQIKDEALCGNPFGIPLTWLLGDCSSRPNPFQLFSETLGATVANDGAVVVGAAGDLDADGDLPIGFLPGLRDRYAVSVGGLQYESGVGSEPIAWNRTRPASYVDVSGFAENVVGLSAAGSSQYDTDFTSTAASASIGAGVAGLLKAEMSALTGEDVEHILKQTARDAGAPGRDDLTGAGAIDAEAALAYVRNNDVQRSTQFPSQILSDQTVETNVDLRRSGYWEWGQTDGGGGCGTGRLEVKADLHKFQARVPYSQTFSSTPDAWVRWGQSDGYQSVLGNGLSWFDPYEKDLRVIEVSETGMTVEGYYWIASFWNRANERCAHNIRIPTFPSSFNIAYTAVGTEGPPPQPQPASNLTASCVINDSPDLSWDASPSPDVDHYDVLRKAYPGETEFSVVGSTSSTSYTDTFIFCEDGFNAEAEYSYKVVAVDIDDYESEPSNTVSIFGTDDAPTGYSTTTPEGPAGASPKSGPVLPDQFALDTSVPNPVRTQATIRYALPEAAHVTLTVYDVMGREVTRLVQSAKAAGFHEVQYDTSTLPSGTYLYRVRAGAFTQTKRMVVVR